MAEIPTAVRPSTSDAALGHSSSPLQHDEEEQQQQQFQQSRALSNAELVDPDSLSATSLVASSRPNRATSSPLLQQQGDASAGQEQDGEDQFDEQEGISTAQAAVKRHSQLYRGGLTSTSALLPSAGGAHEASAGLEIATPIKVRGKSVSASTTTGASARYATIGNHHPLDSSKAGGSASSTTPASAAGTKPSSRSTDDGDMLGLRASNRRRKFAKGTSEAELRDSFLDLVPRLLNQQRRHSSDVDRRPFPDAAGNPRPLFQLQPIPAASERALTASKPDLAAPSTSQDAAAAPLPDTIMQDAEPALETTAAKEARATQADRVGDAGATDDDALLSSPAATAAVAMAAPRKPSRTSVTSIPLVSALRRSSTRQSNADEERDRVADMASPGFSDRYVTSSIGNLSGTSGEDDDSYAESMAAQRARQRAARLSIVSESRSRPVSAIYGSTEGTLSEQGFPGRPMSMYAESTGVAGAPEMSRDNSDDFVRVSRFTSNFFIRVDSGDMQHARKQVKIKHIGRFLMGDVIGEGSYGKVKEGFSTETLHRVAIKIMKKQKLKKIANGEANVAREIRILRKLRHANIVQLMDVQYKEEKGKIYVILEYCPGGSLQAILDHAGGKLKPFRAQHYFKQLVAGMIHCHARSIVHRDLKPANFLILPDHTLKITDFGVAEELDPFSLQDHCWTSAGSPAFQAPEIAKPSFQASLSGDLDQNMSSSQQLDKADGVFSGTKVDVWAAGVCLWNMISGTYPFSGDTIYALLEKIGKCDYSIPKDIPTAVQALLGWMLTKQPRKRPSFADIASHHWLTADIVFRREEDASATAAVRALSSKQSMFSLNADEDQPSAGEEDAEDGEEEEGDAEDESNQYGAASSGRRGSRRCSERQLRKKYANEDEELLGDEEPLSMRDDEVAPEPLPLSQAASLSGVQLRQGQTPAGRLKEARKVVQWQESNETEVEEESSRTYDEIVQENKYLERPQTAPSRAPLSTSQRSSPTSAGSTSIWRAFGSTSASILPNGSKRDKRMLKSASALDDRSPSQNSRPSTSEGSTERRKNWLTSGSLCRMQ